MVSRYLFESHQIPGKQAVLNHVLNNTLFVPGLFLLIPNDFIYIYLYFAKYVVK